MALDKQEKNMEIKELGNHRVHHSVARKISRNDMNEIIKEMCGKSHEIY